jgi:hypothetical protein
MKEHAGEIRGERVGAVGGGWEYRLWVPHDVELQDGDKVLVHVVGDEETENPHPKTKPMEFTIKGVQDAMRKAVQGEL